MKNIPTSLLFVFLMSCLLLVSSCGGKQESQPPPVSAPLPAPQPVAKAVAKPAAKPTKSAPQSKKQGAKQEEPLTSNDFSVQPARPNFGVLAYTTVSPRDKFVAVIPPPGYDATEFTVSSPADSEKRISNQQPKVTLNLPESFSPLLEFGVNAQGQPQRINHTPTGYQLQLIPAGVFIMGSNNGPADAKPEHSVYLSDYYIGVTEVTLGQYEQFALAAKEGKGPQPGVAGNKGDSPDVPVIGITWRDALNFTNFYEMALPTEAQWEKAARGQLGYSYPWGNDRPLWEKPRRIGQITPVQSYQNDVSPFGIYDVSGNAREWTNDWYSSKAYETTTESDGSPLRDPTGPNKAEITSHRVIKGGQTDWHLSNRSSASMKDGPKDVGFRCVLNLVK